MQKIRSIFRDSAQELKSTRAITVSAMLGAISMILGNFTIVVSSSLEISFFFLPSRIVYYLFGPTTGALFGAAIDILTYIVKPTGAFHPGFTINAALSGMIFGLILYKKPLKLSRIFVASTINMIIVNIILNTYWISNLIGNSMWVMLPARIVKNLVLLPFESILLYLVIRAVEATGAFNMLSQGRGKRS